MKWHDNWDSTPSKPSQSPASGFFKLELRCLRKRRAVWVRNSPLYRKAVGTDAWASSGQERRQRGRTDSPRLSVSTLRVLSAQRLPKSRRLPQGPLSKPLLQWTLLRMVFCYRQEHESWEPIQESAGKARIRGGEASVSAISYLIQPPFTECQSHAKHGSRC